MPTKGKLYKAKCNIFASENIELVDGEYLTVHHGWEYIDIKKDDIVVFIDTAAYIKLKYSKDNFEDTNVYYETYSILFENNLCYIEISWEVSKDNPELYSKTKEYEWKSIFSEI
jgi:hypothetical protein